MLKLDWTDTPTTGKYATVYVVFELSKTRWQLGMLLPGSEKLSRYPIAGGDLTALASRLARCRAQAARRGKSVRILSCYEAGLDGHWLHRWLTDQGVISHEVDPSSIEVSRRARRAKTDRIDLEKLMRTFLAYLRGEPRVCSMVHVPTVGDEDRKRRTRERERLPVHEGLGYRAFVPDRIQGDAVFPAYVIHSPVQDHVSPSIARPIVPSIKRRAGLAAVKAWPGYDAACRARAVPASLDRGCARRSTGSRSGRRNALGRTKKLKRPLPEEFAAMPAS